MHFRSFLVAVLTCMTLFFALPTAAAQDAAPAAEEAESTAVEEAPEYPFTPGTFDLMLTGHLSLVMPYIEPGVEFGMIPLTDELTLGIGANVAFGACILCSILTFATPDGYEISAWFIHPLLRAGVHLNMLSDAIGMPQLDVYAGALAGPGIYNFDMQIVGNNFHFRQISLLLGPMAGARYTFSGNSGFFVSTEFRLLAEFGVATTAVDVQVSQDEQRQAYDTAEGFTRGGFDWGFGIGFRI